MEAQLNCLCNYVRKVYVLDNNTAVVEAIDNAKEAETADNNKIQTNTNNSKNNKYVSAADSFDNINGSGVANDNISISTMSLTTLILCQIILKYMI